MERHWLTNLSVSYRVQNVGKSHETAGVIREAFLRVVCQIVAWYSEVICVSVKKIMHDVQYSQIWLKLLCLSSFQI
jgi:hypothetical protein